MQSVLISQPLVSLIFIFSFILHAKPQSWLVGHLVYVFHSFSLSLFYFCLSTSLCKVITQSMTDISIKNPRSRIRAKRIQRGENTLFFSLTFASFHIFYLYFLTALSFHFLGIYILLPLNFLLSLFFHLFFVNFFNLFLLYNFSVSHPLFFKSFTHKSFFLISSCDFIIYFDVILCVCSVSTKRPKGQ